VDIVTFSTIQASLQKFDTSTICTDGSKGVIVGVSTTPGVGVAGMYTMESANGASYPAVLDLNNQSGGKAGIWAGGMGLAVDGNRIFFATGNGQGHANGQTPASGRSPLPTLDEVVANFAVSTDGKFTLTDYFEPYEYMTLDAGDRDLGSGGVALLDSTVFKGTGVARIAGKYACKDGVVILTGL
jgi:iron transport multicopper oxidase